MKYFIIIALFLLPILSSAQVQFGSKDKMYTKNRAVMLDEETVQYYVEDAKREEGGKFIKKEIKLDQFDLWMYKRMSDKKSKDQVILVFLPKYIKDRK